MESLRVKAINDLSTRASVELDGSAKITAIFQENVFTTRTAREFLSDEAYKSLTGSIKGGKKIDRAVANQIAAGLRQWAELKGKTLCIPTIFVSYTGETLDYKAPLLKSLEAMNRAAVDVCNYFDKNVTKVIGTLGWEQEYFVIDEALANARPDLVMSGRTVFGHPPAKGQQLEDHYFGSIPERVYA